MDTSAFQRIVDDIQDKIASGELPPGQRLPSYQELATQYGCSVSTVHAALRALKLIGCIVGQPGRGTYVADKPPAT